MPVQKPPVILAFNCHSSYNVLREIGNSNDFTEQIFGVKPLPLIVDWTPIKPWWANPLTPSAMRYILFDLQPNFSRQRAERWVYEPGFVKRVRHDEILPALSVRLSIEEIQGSFNSEWCDAVKIVILEAAFFDGTTEEFVKRVFLGQDFSDPLFPNAVHYSHIRCTNGFDEVWVKELAVAKELANKELRAKRIEQAAAKASLTPEELLAKPISELDLHGRYQSALNFHCFTTIGSLVDADEDDLLSRPGISHATVRAVRKALAQVGLPLKGEEVSEA